jgi:hypothetical protein
MKAIAHERRFGYRRLHVLLRRDGYRKRQADPIWRTLGE